MNSSEHTIVGVTNVETNGVITVSVILADKNTSVTLYTGSDWLRAKQLEQRFQQEIDAHPMRSPTVTVRIDV